MHPCTPSSWMSVWVLACCSVDILLSMGDSLAHQSWLLPLIHHGCLSFRVCLFSDWSVNLSAEACIWALRVCLTFWWQRFPPLAETRLTSFPDDLAREKHTCLDVWGTGILFSEDWEDAGLGTSIQGKHSRVIAGSTLVWYQALIQKALCISMQLSSWFRKPEPAWNGADPGWALSSSVQYIGFGHDFYRQGSLITLSCAAVILMVWFGSNRLEWGFLCEISWRLARMDLRKAHLRYIPGGQNKSLMGRGSLWELLLLLAPSTLYPAHSNHHCYHPEWNACQPLRALLPSCSKYPVLCSVSAKWRHPDILSSS